MSCVRYVFPTVETFQWFLVEVPPAEHCLVQSADFPVKKRLPVFYQRLFEIEVLLRENTLAGSAIESFDSKLFSQQISNSGLKI